MALCLPVHNIALLRQVGQLDYANARGNIFEAFSDGLCVAAAGIIVVRQMSINVAAIQAVITGKRSFVCQSNDLGNGQKQT
jgi:hypothetical protein